MNKTTRLRQLVEGEGILVAPGVYDALTAKLVQQAGFDAVYLSGAGVSYTALGMPDLGLLSFTEMVERARNMAEAVDVPVLADGDNGYGNALNVMRTVREYERAGIAGIQLEDQSLPKRCGHLAGKHVIPMQEMVGKLAAALDARVDPDFLIIARTDTNTVLGLEEAVARAQAYAEAGADVVFVESPRSEEELQTVAQEVNRPLMANMVENGLTPLLPAARLQELGYSLVIFPNSLTRFVVKQAMGFLQRLRADGSSQAMLE